MRYEMLTIALFPSLFRMQSFCLVALLFTIVSFHPDEGLSWAGSVSGLSHELDHLHVKNCNAPQLLYLEDDEFIYIVNSANSLQYHRELLSFQSCSEAIDFKLAYIVTSNADAETVRMRLDAYGLWTRSLVATYNTIVPFSSSGVFEMIKNQIAQVYASVHYKCPKVIYVSFGDPHDVDLDNVMVQSIPLALSCQSVIYVTQAEIESLSTLVYSLESYGYQGYVINEEEATPAGGGSVASLLLVPLRSRSKILPQSLPSYRSVLNPSLSRPESAAISLDLDMITVPYSLISCFHNATPPTLYQFTMQLYDISNVTISKQQVTYGCVVWISRLYAHWQTQLATLSESCSFRKSYGRAQEQFTKEAGELVQHCEDFSLKRHRMLQYLYDKKIEMLKNTQISEINLLDTKSMFQRDIFEIQFDELLCAEPIWCNYTLAMQQRIYDWQNPPLLSTNEGQRSCENAKFLVVEVPSHINGIGSMIMLVASAMRYATCLNRILVVRMVDQADTMLKWRHHGCQGGMIDCYFTPLSHCAVPYDEFMKAPVNYGEKDFDMYPFRVQKVLVVTSAYLSTGKCSLCFSQWDLGSTFWDGVYLAGYNDKYDTNFTYDSLPYYRSFATDLKLIWASQFLRYILRPRPWLKETLHQIMAYGLSVHEHGSLEQFLSLHIRYGMKLLEVPQVPIERYMEFVKRKLPTMKDIFVSTETATVITKLHADYPEYRFHFLVYPRTENLVLSLGINDDPIVQEAFVDEFLYSLTNLYIASEAHGFVGTLSSNWCMMIHHLERTRGDGGYDYHSLDSGSVYTACY